MLVAMMVLLLLPSVMLLVALPRLPLDIGDNFAANQVALHSLLAACNFLELLLLALEQFDRLVNLLCVQFFLCDLAVAVSIEHLAENALVARHLWLSESTDGVIRHFHWQITGGRAVGNRGDISAC